MKTKNYNPLESSFSKRTERVKAVKKQQLLHSAGQLELFFPFPCELRSANPAAWFFVAYLISNTKPETLNVITSFKLDNLVSS